MSFGMGSDYSLSTGEGTTPLHAAIYADCDSSGECLTFAIWAKLDGRRAHVVMR